MSENLIEKIKQLVAKKPTLQRFDGRAWHNNYTNIGVYTKALEKYVLDFESYVLKILEDEKQAIVEMDEFLKELKEQGFVVVEREKLQHFKKWVESLVVADQFSKSARLAKLNEKFELFGVESVKDTKKENLK